MLRRNILIVEDSKSILAFVREMLSEHFPDYTMMDVMDGHQALDVIDSVSPPELVLLDIDLPRADGLELLTAIRKKASWKDVPVIMATSKTGKDVVLKAIKLGANDYMTKPYDEEEFISKIKKHLPEQ